MSTKRIVDGYFDDCPKCTPQEKLKRGLALFKQQYGVSPTYVRVSAWTAEQLAGCGLEIRVDPWLHRDSLYLGVEP